ncbi:MAG: hypothetical protein GAK34_02939 [Delftia tsuruhatensis]|nr:MAG: hypothetical protein GAK34_02939 [Delftia tsuruhatensis]
MHTSASAQWALTMYSTESAMMSRLGSEYSMPSWPMAMPSSTAMVLNSLATPPAASISRATSWPRSLRWTWPGTNCVKELAMAMMGLSKSPSFMPVARHRARAPAMLRPPVEVLERYAGMGNPVVCRLGPSLVLWGRPGSGRRLWRSTRRTAGAQECPGRRGPPLCRPQASPAAKPAAQFRSDQRRERVPVPMASLFFSMRFRRRCSILSAARRLV